ncbi:MAG: ribonuclease HII [Candidatus Moranbacteria bacterium CG2_30_45_14]|nr:MAG: ribonuclease HII [Candidatus Moranbacteria bacterium CG2_30_45_14]
MQGTTFEKELSLMKKKIQSPLFVVGIDEAGRGPLCGPVVAGAVCYKRSDFFIPPELEKKFAFIRDSKKLSPKKREAMFDFIQEHFYVGVGIVSAETIDRVNILQATFLAMKSAVSRLMNNFPREAKERSYLLIDGNQEIPNFSYPQEAVIGGDGIVKSIAAASIIAKVTRDRIIEAYDTEYPGYGFAQHKGYGTKIHMDALRHLGPCPIHRMSFRPVLLALPENVNKRFANVLKPRKK